MKKAIFFPFYFLIFSSISLAQVYQCKNSDGSISYQGQACRGETVKTLVSKKKAIAASRVQMMAALSKLTGKSVAELNTPENLKAAEALVVTDASRAYAYTLIHQAPLKYCDRSVNASMNRYKSLARDAILLGKHYYSKGIDLKVKGRDFSKSGEELTTALDEMISKREIEYESMTGTEKQKLCTQTKQALDLLAKTYEKSTLRNIPRQPIVDTESDLAT